MRCGVCGVQSKIGANLFVCSAARNRVTCSNRAHVRRDVLEATAPDALRIKLMDPDLFAGFVGRRGDIALAGLQLGDLVRARRRAPSRRSARSLRSPQSRSPPRFPVAGSSN